MIVLNLNLLCLPSFPVETNTPLIVDANTVLARPVAAQGFQSIAWWRPQITQIIGIFHVEQLAASGLLNSERQFPRDLPVENSFGFPVSKRPYHVAILS